jgi:hypothetical protein
MDCTLIEQRGKYFIYRDLHERYLIVDEEGNILEKN